MRRRVRAALCSCARGVGWLRARERQQRGRWTILTYHRVLDEAGCANYPFPSLAMPVAIFEQQLAWLAQHALVLPVGEALAAAARTDARPMISISFDDGYADNAELAAPLLGRYGLRATFFVTTGFVGKDDRMWYDRAVVRIASAPSEALHAAARRHRLAAPVGAEHGGTAAAWVEALKTLPAPGRDAFLAALSELPAEHAQLDRFRAMRPEQVAALSRGGHEIASHSVTHEILTLAGDHQLADELAGSRRTLREWTGAEIAGFCYPNGSHDARVVAAVGAAGYRYACTTEPPRPGAAADPLRLPRRDLSPARLTRADGSFHHASFRAELVGMLDAFRAAPPRPARTSG